ncbi:hypothetical protein [Mesorhizobium sp. KR1-2]|uniref:hypothetical protein n=1 Tax=Mesorhizobium sp. KR1-2 TaxID=3156609 RepID=UPI0032B4348E
MFTPEFFRAVRHYAGKIQTMRDQIRTERFFNSLPESIQKDIGWPDTYAARRARRS